MALIDTTQKNLLQLKKDYLDKSFEVHGKNLSQTNVPGAKAKTLKPFKDVLLQKRALPQQSLSKTSEGHISPKAETSISHIIQTQGLTPSLSGNTIDADLEMAELSKIAHERKALTTIEKGEVDLYKMILRTQ